jgi:hypothetical protein
MRIFCGKYKDVYKRSEFLYIVISGNINAADVFEFLKTVAIKSSVFWNVTQCSLVVVYGRFG